MPTAKRLGAVFGLLMVVTVLSPGVHALQRSAAQPAGDAVGVLLGAKPGTYVVNGLGLGARIDANALSVFVQPDVYALAQGGVEVTVAIGAQVPGAWTGRLRITKTDATSSQKAAGEEALSGAAGSVRQTSRFELAPGTYELVLALVSAAPGSRTVGTVVRQIVTVPNMAAPTLASSPVVLGEAASYLTVSLHGRPFVFGTTQLTPAARNQFRQSDQLHFACRVYGWKGDADAKPDLSVEYIFQEHVRDQVRFFNKTKPQELNAKTLARSFDGKTGMIVVGMSVPLNAFPTGAFDVVVRVTDKRTQAMTIQKATFVVRTS